MKRVSSARWIAALAVVLGFEAYAQSIPVDDFAKHNEINQVTLSPTGEYAALAVPSKDGMETQLEVVKLDTGNTQVLRFARQNHVAGVVWTGDEQLVVSRARMQPLRAMPVSVGQLMSSDIHGKTQDTLFGYLRDEGNRRGRRKDEGFASLEMVLDAEPGMALVEFQCWNCGEEPDTVIFKVDTRTGARKEVERADGPASFGFDQTGEARLRTTWDDKDDPVLHYRRNKGGEWLPLPKSVAGRSLFSARFDADNNTLYALISDQGEPSQLYKVDLAAGTRTRLAGRDDVDIAYMMYAGRNGVPFAVVYDADKPSIQYVDPASEWSQLHAGLLKQFPGQMLTLNSFSRDGNKVLFATWSDRNPGSYYVYDRAGKKAQKIVDLAPWMTAEKLAPTRPIAFTARDGQKIYGLYTATGTGPKPMIVMPHGGPHGPYDSWGYSDDVQFLASRGYAVLQVNFRGSGGRGYNFEKAGYREWGGKMMDDIADGVRWTIDNKLADPARICTYGASFGGYAALMQPIRNPDLYKCAIGYVGVYDLTVMHEAGDIPDTKSGRRYLERVLGVDKSVLVANSPAQQVAQVKVPVFLVQGGADRRVPMDQFNALKNAFAQAGTPIETMVVDGEGHGFYKPSNRADLYRRLEAFLQKHIGPRAN